MPCILHITYTCAHQTSWTYMSVTLAVWQSILSQRKGRALSYTATDMRHHGNAPRNTRIDNRCTHTVRPESLYQRRNIRTLATANTGLGCTGARAPSMPRLRRTERRAHARHTSMPQRKAALMVCARTERRIGSTDTWRQAQTNIIKERTQGDCIEYMRQRYNGHWGHHMHLGQTCKQTRPLYVRHGRQVISMHACVCVCVTCDMCDVSRA